MKRAIDTVLHAVSLLLIASTILILIAPLAMAFLMSLDARPYLGPFPPPALSLRWYTDFFSDDYFIKGLKTSLIVATGTTFVSVVAGVPAALALDRYEFPGKPVVTGLILSPLLIPGVVVGFSLLLLFSAFDLLNGYGRLIAGHAILTLPYVVRSSLATLAGIKTSLIEAAIILGATERQAFWDITLPLARTGIVTGAIFAFAFSLDDVAISMFLTDPHTYTLPVAMVSAMRAQFNMTISAAAVLMMIISAGLLLLMGRAVGFDRIIGKGVYGAR
jgi:putative spermidine/putrescine transport system permease protein